MFCSLCLRISPWAKRARMAALATLATRARLRRSPRDAAAAPGSQGAASWHLLSEKFPGKFSEAEARGSGGNTDSPARAGAEPTRLFAAQWTGGAAAAAAAAWDGNESLAGGAGDG